jgi:L-asparaginase
MRKSISALAAGLVALLVQGQVVKAQAPTGQPTNGTKAAEGAKPSDKNDDKNKPKIRILATGGTIAGKGTSGGYGYKAGAFKIEDLISAVPDLDSLASLSGEQVANIGSQDMNDEVWLKLAHRVNDVLQSSDVDGVVITHGTDTMEETAYFLNLVVKSDKPVVLVGSMRPATAVSADGPANLFNAVAATADPRARGRGVLVVINDEIHAARNVTKMNTTNVETFESPNRGAAGLVSAGKIAWFEPMDKRHTTRSQFNIEGRTRLPRVDIIYAHSNMSPDLIRAALNAGAKGLVIAGVGDGNMSKGATQVLADAVKAGVVVVRSTRLSSGLVLRNSEVNDDQLGFVASGELNPGKSRVLLQLSLTATDDPKSIQRVFEQY